jgi:hypothetical protein
MGKKISVKLIVSPEMDERGKKGEYEHTVVRFPKAARTVIDAQRTHIEIGIGNMGGVVKLEIKQAYKSDLKHLSDMLAKGKLTDDEAELAGFVTGKVWKQVTTEQKTASNKNIWVSDDITNITVGTDPEFGLYKEGKLILANEVPNLTSIGKLGHDWTPAELRPDGSTSHVDIVEEMKHLLKKESKPIKDYDWIAGAGGTINGQIRSFGGHIHIGYPRIIPIDKKELVSRNICQALNDLIALPLVNIDVHFGSERRQITGYGDPTSVDSVRTDYENRFEWRVLSGVWMCSPEAAKAVLGATKACVENIYMLLAEDEFNAESVTKKLNESGGSIFKKIKRLDVNEVNRLVIESPKKGLTKEVTNKCISRLKSLEKYQEYAEDIDAFCDLINKKSDEINFSMKESWL